MSTALIRYDEACRSLEKARATDEVLKLRDGAAMLRAYAKQAKNRDLEISAAEIRMRAERRIGELIQAQRETIGLNKGAKGSKVTGVSQTPVKDTRPTLTEAGIDKNLARRARTLAAIPRAKFEKAIVDWREQQAHKAERVSADLARRARPKQPRPTAKRINAVAASSETTFAPETELLFEIQHRVEEVFFGLGVDEQVDFITNMTQFLANLERRRLRTA